MFENRSKMLRQHIKDWPGDFRNMSLYEEMANVNDGIAEILERLSQSKVCEICDTPEGCLSGKHPCDLCGEFIATVPIAVANKMLDLIRNLSDDPISKLL